MVLCKLGCGMSVMFLAVIGSHSQPKCWYTFNSICEVNPIKLVTRHNLVSLGITCHKLAKVYITWYNLDMICLVEEEEKES